MVFSARTFTPPHTRGGRPTNGNGIYLTEAYPRRVRWREVSGSARGQSQSAEVGFDKGRILGAFSARPPNRADPGLLSPGCAVRGDVGQNLVLIQSKHRVTSRSFLLCTFLSIFDLSAASMSQ
jgi:hypothetical protein